MMRASNGFIATCLLIAFSVPQVHAGQATCPGADKVKDPKCGVKDAESGREVCKYEITTAAGSVWVGDDPDELAKGGKSVTVQFENSHAAADKTLYCDYKLTDADKKESAVRLSLQK